MKLTVFENHPLDPLNTALRTSLDNTKWDFEHSVATAARTKSSYIDKAVSRSRYRVLRNSVTCEFLTDSLCLSGFIRYNAISLHVILRLTSK